MASIKLASILLVVILTTMLINHSSSYVINSRDVYHTRNYEGCRRETEGAYDQCMTQISTDGALSDVEFVQAKRACDQAKAEGKENCIR